MRPYIYGKTKNRTHILDLQKITTSCQEVGNYIDSIIKKNKNILFLCTKKTTLRNQPKNNPEEPAKKQP
jgi:ribosomal protein S2